MKPATLVLLLSGCLDAPSLSVDVPAGTVGPGDVVTIASDAPWVQVGIDGAYRMVPPGPLPLVGLSDGPHRISVQAGGWIRKPSVHQLMVTTDATPPGVLISEQSRKVEQGHTLPIAVRLTEPGSIELTVDGKERPTHAIGPNTHRALVGVPIRQAPGMLPVELVVTDTRGNRETLSWNVEVTAVDWPFTGKLPLSRKKASVPKPDIVKMRSERDPIYAEHTPDALWSGAMRMPTRGRHTSIFGSYREYPDGHRSHHDAEDIAHRRGTPVYAANDGIVRLARMQAVHGNAVLIGHGQGVVSLYSHLHRLDVREGETVTKGQRVGRMGSTGRSTGPHLHWGIVVDHVPIDPMQWLDTGFELVDLEPFAPL